MRVADLAGPSLILGKDSLSRRNRKRLIPLQQISNLVIELQTREKHAHACTNAPSGPPPPPLCPSSSWRAPRPPTLPEVKAHLEDAPAHAALLVANNLPATDD